MFIELNYKEELEDYLKNFTAIELVKKIKEIEEYYDKLKQEEFRKSDTDYQKCSLLTSLKEERIKEIKTIETIEKMWKEGLTFEDLNQFCKKLYLDRKNYEKACRLP